MNVCASCGTRDVPLRRSAHLGTGVAFCDADCRDAYIGATHRYRPHDAEHVLVPVGSQLGVLWRGALAPRAGPTLGRRTDDGRHYVLPYDVVEPIAAALQRIGPQTKRGAPSGGEEEGGEERETGPARRALTASMHYGSGAKIFSEDTSWHDAYVILQGMDIGQLLQFAAGMRFTPFYDETLAVEAFWTGIIDKWFVKPMRNPDLAHRRGFMGVFVMRVVQSLFGRDDSPAVTALLGACFNWLYVNCISQYPAYSLDAKPRDAVQETFDSFCTFSVTGVSARLLRFVQQYRYMGRGVLLHSLTAFGELHNDFILTVLGTTTNIAEAYTERKALQARRAAQQAAKKAAATAVAAGSAASAGDVAMSGSAGPPAPEDAYAAAIAKVERKKQLAVVADKEKAEFFKVLIEWSDALGRRVEIPLRAIYNALDGGHGGIIRSGPRTTLQLARLALEHHYSEKRLMSLVIDLLMTEEGRYDPPPPGLGVPLDYARAIVSAVSPSGRCVDLSAMAGAGLPGDKMDNFNVMMVVLLAEWRHPVTGARIDFTQTWLAERIAKSLCVVARESHFTTSDIVWRPAFDALINMPVALRVAPVLCDALMRHGAPKSDDDPRTREKKYFLIEAWSRRLRELGPAAPGHARLIAPDTLMLYPPTLEVRMGTAKVVNLLATELRVRDPVTGADMPVRDWIAQNLELYFLTVPAVPYGRNIESSYLFKWGETIWDGLGLPRIDLHRLRARLATPDGTGPSYLWDAERAGREQAMVRAIEAEEAAKAAASTAASGEAHATASPMMNVDARIWRRQY